MRMVIGFLFLFCACQKTPDKADDPASAPAPAAVVPESALRPLADEVKSLFEAAREQKAARAGSFALPKETPSIDFADQPRGRFETHLFFVETGVLAELEGGGYGRFKLGLTLGPNGLKLSEARARLEASLPADMPKPLPVPKAIEQSILEVFARAKAGRFASLKLDASDYAWAKDPTMATHLVAIGGEQFFDDAAQIAARAQKIVAVELDDIGILGVDTDGSVFLAGADLDRGDDGYFFDKNPDGHLFTARAVSWLPAARWQTDLDTICKLATATAAAPPAEKPNLAQTFQERLAKASVSAVARQLFGAWSRSPKALEKAHAQRLLEEAGGPRSWSCAGLEQVWGW
jgi:hypothetical protein